MDLWSTGIYTGTSTGTSTGSMTRGRSIGFGSRTDTALRSSLLSTISYLVRLASYFLLGNGMPDLGAHNVKYWWAVWGSIEAIPPGPGV